VNHKPAVDYSEDELIKALGDAFEPGQDGEDKETIETAADGSTVKKSQLETLLQLYGTSDCFLNVIRRSIYKRGTRCRIRRASWW
jgi:hypothetical protein